MTQEKKGRGRPKKTELARGDSIRNKQMFLYVGTYAQPSNLAEALSQGLLYDTMKLAKADAEPGSLIASITIDAVISGPIHRVKPEEDDV
jgi:hypothetical protein